MAKYFVVRKGKIPGIYTDRDSCKAQVDGVAGAKYKGFPSLALAQEAYTGGGRRSANFPIDKQAIAVDAACSKNPGPMEYQGVDLATRKRIFHQAFPTGTNNIGEFLALVHGLKYLIEHPQYTGIYSDSKQALTWIRDGMCRTNLPCTKETEGVFVEIKDAEAWLATHSIKHIQLHKRETKDWGQIPADFGRK